ncbi:MAG: hypothetical protein B1H13_02085 [Desulfobacteraceae bacterium 4484_190.3]|nr:MAG: hypothetical protein B1H13_02085 [Desulfobacteraceae bacterium 4484_190.3]
MGESKIQEKAVEAIIIMNAAITNLRIYPPASAMINNTVDRAYKVFLAILEDEESVIFAESEKNILVCGQLLDQKDQGRPQVIAFLKLLLDFGIKSVTFERGMDRSELLTFLEIMKEKPENVEKEGGMQKVAENKKMPHIILDQKVYVATDKDRQILSGLDIKDEEIIKYLVGDDATSDVSMEKIKELARDPERISRIIQTGMKHATVAKGIVPDSEVSENVILMVRALDKIADRVDKEKISSQVAKTIAGMDIEVISAVLIQGIDELIRDGVFDQIANEIDDETFEAIVANIKHISDRISAGDEKYIYSNIESARRAYRSMMNSDKGQRKKDEIEKRIAGEEKEEEKKIVQLKDTVSHILKGEKEYFFDERMMQSLSGITKQLFVKKKNETCEDIIDKFSGGLFSENAEVRAQASEALSRIIGSLTVEQRTVMVSRISGRLVDWIKIETTVTPAYKKICDELKNLAQTMIIGRQFAECRHILDVFNMIHSGKVEKIKEIQDISGDVLREIATEEILDILFDEFETNKQNGLGDAGFNLSRLGTAPLNRLLKILLESPDSAERVRILKIVSEIGHVAIPVLTERIKEDEPWYFIRNLVYLIGKVGGKDQAKLLEPFLVSQYPKVREETLKSIYCIGEEYRTNIFLSALSIADNQMKIGIVDMLGSMRDTNSVRPLLKLLESKPLITSKVRNKLEEKICVALGNIGSQEAIPTLMAISRRRDLLGVKRYSPKVKIAAGKALAAIRRKQSEEDNRKHR